MRFLGGKIVSGRMLRDAAVHWLIPFLLTAFGLVLVNLIWLVPALDATRTSASVLALEIAHRIQGSIAADLETDLREVQSGADEIGREPGRGSIVLMRLFNEYPDIEEISLTDRNGSEVIRMNRTQGILTDLRSHAKDPYFYSALQGAANFGEVTLSGARDPHTTLAVAVGQNGKTVQVLIADLNLRGLVRAVRGLSEVSGHLYVVDRNGYEIAHPDPAEILRRPNYMSRAIVQKIVVDGKVADGLAPEDSYVNEQGEQIFAVGLPISIAGLGLILEQPRATALAGERQMLLFAGAAIGLGLLVLAVILGSNVRLTRFNASMRELVIDLENAGKMLVRRDLELTRANARLEELDQIKTEFVSIAAHQLRTPLTGIRWSYQTLLDGDTGGVNADQRRLLESGLGATLRMVDLVNDLLSVARIEEGKFGIRLRKQSIAPLLALLAGRYETLASQKGITFSADIPGDLPDVAIDEEKMGIVLDNLLDNALKYTEPGKTIGVKAFFESDKVHIEIADAGIGISSGQLHRVFTKFFRADNALRLHTSGTGLGLYVVKNIVEKHGGTVDVVSNEGKGSVFRITLPVA